MTDRDKLPVKASTGYVVVSTEQSSSLVARGLEAVRNRQKEPILLPEADPESQFGDADRTAKLNQQEWLQRAADPSLSSEASAAAKRVALLWGDKLRLSRKAHRLYLNLAADPGPSPGASDVAKLIGRSWLVVTQSKQQPLVITKGQFESLSAEAQDEAKRIGRNCEIYKRVIQDYAEAIELWRKVKK